MSFFSDGFGGARTNSSHLLREIDLCRPDNPSEILEIRWEHFFIISKFNRSVLRVTYTIGLISRVTGKSVGLRLFLDRQVKSGGFLTWFDIYPSLADSTSHGLISQVNLPGFLSFAQFASCWLIFVNVSRISINHRQYYFEIWPQTRASCLTRDIYPADLTIVYAKGNKNCEWLTGQIKPSGFINLLSVWLTWSCMWLFRRGAKHTNVKYFFGQPCAWDNLYSNGRNRMPFFHTYVPRPITKIIVFAFLLLIST
jgi:hypothetical protein